MHPNAQWLDRQQAATLIGYSDPGSVSRFATKYGVETRPGQRKGWLLYSKGDIFKVLEQTDTAKYTNKSCQPSGFLKRFDTHFRLTGDHLIISDTHCPLVDIAFVQTAIKTAHKEKVGKLLVAGDFWDCCALSTFPKLFPIPWSEEKKSGGALLDLLSKEFDKVYLITGNHEMRYLLRLGIPQDTDLLNNGINTDLWELAASRLDQKYQDRVEFSIYPKAEIDEWFITHPKNFRIVPGSTGRTLSQIEWKKNVLIGHAHMTAISQNPSGNGWIVDLGTMFDPVHCDYKNLQETTHPKWTESFGILRDGFCTVYVKGNKPLMQVA